MNKDIEIQIISEHENIPEPALLEQWLVASLINKIDNAEICIRVVDEQEIKNLNKQYRDKNNATNVLSFSYLDEFDTDTQVHGDIIICAPIIEKEAIAQQKNHTAHWAHMIIHGGLHLQGFDHENENDAEIMENHEVIILNTLGFDNPYLLKNKISSEP